MKTVTLSTWERKTLAGWVKGNIQDLLKEDLSDYGEETVALLQALLAKLA